MLSFSSLLSFFCYRNNQTASYAASAVGGEIEGRSDVRSEEQPGSIEPVALNPNRAPSPERDFVTLAQVINQERVPVIPDIDDAAVEDHTFQVTAINTQPDVHVLVKKSICERISSVFNSCIGVLRNHKTNLVLIAIGAASTYISYHISYQRGYAAGRDSVTLVSFLSGILS